MNDLKLISRDEITFDIKETDTFDGEIIPGGFTLTETWDFLNWDETEEYSSFTIKSGTNAIFLINLVQYLPASIIFNVTLTNCSDSYDCEIQIDIVNSNEFRNANRILYHNFTFKKPSIDIRIPIRKMKFNEEDGFINSNSLRARFSFSHESNTPSKRKKKTQPTAISKCISPISSTKSIPKLSDDSEPEKEIDTYTEKYCGIRNQGATCYINSILQTLFHIPAFRKVIFEFNCEKYYENYEKTTLWNLQRLFAQLQTKSDPVSTKLLTNSFGWDNDDIFYQQDIHEFLLKFLSIVESKLKAELKIDPVAKLFQGKLRTLIKCLNVDFEYSKPEDFFTIPLDVKDCTSLEDSLSRFTEPEHMEGSNQYKAEGYGLQDATLTTKLAFLPPVLFFQLRRFEYDAKLNQKVKINSKFTFPLNLNMNGYMSKDASNDPENFYELFGVLAHAGEVENGHFFVFLRTSPNDPSWFKFNDSLVSVVSQKSAIEENFGNDEESTEKVSTSHHRIDISEKDDDDSDKLNSSAYMLVYMQCTKLNELFCKVPNSLIPRSCLTEVSDINVQNNVLQVKIFTDDSVDSQRMTFSDPLKFEIRKNKTMSDLYEKVQNTLKTKYIRLHYFYNSSLLGRVLCRSNIKVSSLCTSEFFAETSNEKAINVFDNDIMLFIEFFSPHFKPFPIQFIQRVAISRDEPVATVIPLIDQKVKFPHQNSLIAFVQNFDELHEIDFFKTPNQLMLTDGCFIVFQVLPQFRQPKPPSNVGEFGSDIRYFDVFPEFIPKMVDQYYKLVIRSIKFNVICPLKSIQKVEVPPTLDFHQLKLLISRIFKVEVKSSRSFLALYLGNSVKPLDESQYETIGEIIHNNAQITVKSIDKQNNFLRVILSYSSDGFQKDMVVLKFFPSGSKVEDLMSYVRMRKKLEESVDLRALAIKGAKVTRILQPEEFIEDLKNPIRIEIVPEDQKILENDKSFLAKFEKLTVENEEDVPFGMPFLFKIVPDETFENTKKRIFEKLGVAPKIQSEVQFFFDDEDDDDDEEEEEEEEEEDKEISNDTVLADNPKARTQIAIVFPQVKKEHKKEDGVKLYE